MNKLTPTIIAVLVTSILLFIIWFLYNYIELYEEKQKEKKIEYFTERFVAAKNLLHQYQVNLVPNASLKLLDHPLEDGTSLFLNTPVARLSKARFTAITEFVSTGGHLIYAPYLKKNKPETRQDPLLDELNTHINWHDNSKAVTDYEYRYFSNVLAIQSKANYSFVFSSDERPVPVLQYAYGEGLITLINDDSLWLNNQIQRGDHAYLLVKLMEGNEVLHVIWLPFRPNLLTAIWEHYALSVTVFLITIALWLHQKSRRNVAISSQSKQSRRSIIEHIRAIGWLHFRTKNCDILVKNLRDELEQWASTRHPAFLQLSHDNKIRFFVKNSSCSVEDIALCYQTHLPDNSTVLQAIRTIQQLRKSL